MTVPIDTRPAKHHTFLRERLDEIGWGVFLVMTGLLWLLPGDRVPPGGWMIATGLLLLVLNALRHFGGMTASFFTTLLGVVLLAGGLSEWSHVQLPVLAIAVIVMGAAVLGRPFIHRKA